MLRLLLIATSISMGLVQFQTLLANDPLPSWNEGAVKSSILQFVAKVTNKDLPSYVEADDRIATFDNDGTLWSENPLYFQLFFALDRVRALAPDHPEWKEKEPFASILNDDLASMLAGGEAALAQIVLTTHAGMTTDAFTEQVNSWITTARHPSTGLLFTEMVYQPMQELIKYLRANGFKTYIVSGGGVEFMRPWVHRVYGIPPEQVIGSSIKTKYEVRDGLPVLVRIPEIHFIDDKEGKPVAIHEFIGRRPLAAFGNSDGDYPMLEWTTTSEGTRFGLLVHHTDDAREWAYDRDSHVGRLDKGLDMAEQNGWVVVDMKRDWNSVWINGKHK